MTQKRYTEIPKRQKCINKEEPYIGGAKDILDDELNKPQSQVNNEVLTEIGADNVPNSIKGRVKGLEDQVGEGGTVDERIEAAVEPKANSSDVYAKTETYNKTELNNMITTPSQEYVTVTATDQTTAVTDVLPATGEADTVYRVGNWDGTQYDTTCYTEYAWNGSAYVKLNTKSQVGEVYDISANHTGATYADLSAALGSNGVNIPESLRKGGMSVKFVQTSNNNYVQWRLKSQEFSVNVNNWIGEEIKSVESLEEEQRWEDDNNTEVYAKVNKNGIFAKKYHAINGTELQFVDPVEELKKEVCNINYNTVSLSPFIKKYINKECDEWNQLNIAMCGDSIFGIQANPGMALTPDCNDESETDPGYITGHFPPNMWVQGVGYKLLKALQYDSADVKYYNHVASEITKTGAWTDLFSQSNNLDKVRAIKSVESGDTISLSFSSAAYAKLIITDYLASTEDATIKVTISENGGDYVTPESLGITESHSFAEGHSGEYILRDINGIKFSQFVFKGFDTNKNYILKVEHTDNNNLVVWGFETWTRERLNVVVTAEGANTAANQFNSPQRFYNENTNADLCVINAPFLNDFSTAGWQTWYKGKITLSSTAPTSPSQYNFYYCEESGVYANFGSIKASVGDYIEWSGSQWVLGSSKLNTLFNAYNNYFPAMLDMCKKIGIPMLIIATHASDVFIGKPFIETAVKLMRLHIENYQFPCIDVYKYREDLNLTDIWADGTHLNDTGIAMYINLISEVLNKDCEIAHACESWKCGDFYGHSEGGDVTFRYVGSPSFSYLKLKNLPKVYILNNLNVTVTNITKQGFSVSGSGEFDYHIVVNN